MKIWLIKASENLPIDDNSKLERMGLMAEFLARNGDEVTWWTSTFCHAKKKHRYKKNKSIVLNQNEKINLLYSAITYKKNISIGRILYCKNMARILKREMILAEQPDIIVCAWPIPEMARKTVLYAAKRNIPVVIDVRDLWPDIFLSIFPDNMQNALKFLIKPYEKLVERTMMKATGIIGVTEHAVLWGVRKARREIGCFDQIFPLACKKIQMTDAEIVQQKKWWEKWNITESTYNICFFSTLSLRGLDLECFIKAVLIASEKYNNLRFIIGGTGDGEKYYKKIAGDSKNIVFAGWLNEKQMSTAMMMSICGVYCLKNTEDLKNTFSNKIVQYLEGGLPVISSLTGKSKEIIEKNRMGIIYQEGDVKDCCMQILRLIEDKEFFNDMRVNSRTYYEINHESNTVNKKICEYLHQIVRNIN